MKKAYSLYLTSEVIERLDNGCNNFLPRSRVVDLVLRNFLDSKETIPEALKKVRLIQTDA